MDSYKKVNLVSESLRLFLLLFFSLGALVVGVLAAFYTTQMNALLDSMKADEMNTLTIQENVMASKLRDILSDLLFLSEKKDLKSYLDTDDAKTLADIASEYQVLSLYKKRYDQIRYLDATGQEIVRINYNDAMPSIVEKEALQNKSDRYYFRDTFRLNAGGIFVSPFDLNIENGKIERPFKPMIRIGIPIFDREKQKRGIIVLNYLGQELLDTIARASTHLEGTAMLLNDQGYWLFHSDTEKQWGFMLEERKMQNFAKIYPEEWQRMLRQKTGQIHTTNGLFSFTLMHPLCSTDLSSKRHDTDLALDKTAFSDSCRWILVAHISPEILKNHTRPLQQYFFLLGMGLLVFTGLIVWFLAFSITKRRIYQNELLIMALHDTLTSLPKRKLFFEQLETGISYANRNEQQLGVLYVDLDGFKKVNDKFGHEAGDELLVQASKRMRAVMRKTDTVARIGGDEFAIVLFQINSREGSLAAGEKILREINKPIRLKCGTVTVGASIGAAVYPDTAKNAKDLVKYADRAMYFSKQKGKNVCTLSEVQG